ncbi:hypothetical protein D9M72_438380 [compost metagenome]
MLNSVSSPPQPLLLKCVPTSYVFAFSGVRPLVVCAIWKYCSGPNETPALANSFHWSLTWYITASEGSGSLDETSLRAPLKLSVTYDRMNS